jgi:hypothetical protein
MTVPSPLTRSPLLADAAYYFREVVKGQSHLCGEHDGVVVGVAAGCQLVLPLVWSSPAIAGGDAAGETVRVVEFGGVGERGQQDTETAGGQP